MSRSLLFSFAHPDDESFCGAGLVMQCQAAGAPTVLVTATLGQRGKTGNPPSVSTRTSSDMSRGGAQTGRGDPRHSRGAHPRIPGPRARRGSVRRDPTFPRRPDSSSSARPSCSRSTRTASTSTRITWPSAGSPSTPSPPQGIPDGSHRQANLTSSAGCCGRRRWQCGRRRARQICRRSLASISSSTSPLGKIGRPLR